MAVFRGFTEAGPLLLIVEDAQWVDPATMDTLAWCLDTLAEQPFAVLTLGRPELLRVHPGLFSAAGPTEVSLQPLTVRVAETLVRAGAWGGR